MVICKKCKGIEVQTKTWVEINTSIVHEMADSESKDSQDNWCPDCRENCEIEEIGIKSKKNGN